MSGKKRYQPWSYTLEQTEYYINSPKRSKKRNVAWNLVKNRSQTQGLRFDVELTDTPFLPIAMGYCARGTSNLPTTYSAVFLLDEERTRGIDYTPVKTRHMFDDDKVRHIGWHENIIYHDPKLGYRVNHHDYSLQDWTPSDLDSFYRFTCEHWNIEVPEMERRLI